MRYYGFGNYYLSSIQQGIQNAHVISTLSVKYEHGSRQDSVYREWAANHIVTVLCNGGNSKSIQEMYDLFEDLSKQGMPLPFAKFHEDNQSLDGALTAVGIVVLKRHYEFDSDFLPSHVTEDMFLEFISSRDIAKFEALGLEFGYETWELKLMFTIKGCALAR